MAGSQTIFAGRPCSSSCQGFAGKVDPGHLGEERDRWGQNLQDMKNEDDLAYCTAASSESQCYDPFVGIANKIILKCTENREKYLKDEPSFPIDDLRFYKNETVVIKGDHDGKSHSNWKPDVVALRSRRLKGRLNYATQTSDQLHWSDILIAVEFKASKDMISRRLSCLRSGLLTCALSSTVYKSGVVISEHEFVCQEA